MFALEKISVTIRHLPILRRFPCLTDSIRPAYEMALRILYPKGLLRNIDGIGKIFIHHECRRLDMPHLHELIWWERLTQEIREGDTIVDVGAFIGILTILMAKKSENTGKVFAFEPNPTNLDRLRKNVKLNDVSDRVDMCGIAISDVNNQLILTNEGCVSHIISPTANNIDRVLSISAKSLDELFRNIKIDILKIDVEGYEGNVLLGAKNLLNDRNVRPRFILIECHPYMWKGYGTNAKKIITQLSDSGYAVEVPELPDNDMLDDIKYHWVMFASAR